MNFQGYRRRAPGQPSNSRVEDAQRVILAALAAAVMAAIPAARAGASEADAPFTVAVYGDAPYGTKPTDTSEFNATPAFITSVDADPDVVEVVHDGDMLIGIVDRNF